jgi:hypothetical protein
MSCAAVMTQPPATGSRRPESVGEAPSPASGLVSRARSGRDGIPIVTGTGPREIHLPQHAASLPIPLTQPVTEQTPRAGTRQMPGDRVLLTLQELPPEPARSITSREWAVIAKSPDTHQGQRLIVFGHVTQFDSVTGPTGVPGERGRSAARRVVRLRHEHDPAGVGLAADGHRRGRHVPGGGVGSRVVHV